MREIGRDVLHALTHADKSVLSLIGALTVRPGDVALDFVRGKRRSHFNPFTFFVVLMGVAALALSASNFIDFVATSPSNPVSAFLQRHLNVLIFVQWPLLAAFSGLLFRSKGFNFAERLVLAAYASGLRVVFFTLVVAPLWALTQWNYTAVAGGYMVLWSAYFGLACMQFFAEPGLARGARGWLWVKGVGVAVLTQLSVMALIAAAFTAWYAVR